MKHLKSIIAGLLAATAVGGAIAAEGPVPQGISPIDHVFVIMMENHSFEQVVGNPTMPYLNGLISAKKINVATSYFAVGHPSLTNYLEIVGGSNFGVASDNYPDWHAVHCQTNLHSGLVNADNDSGNSPFALDPNDLVCPISGVGTDMTTAAVDDWNETTPPVFNYLANIDGVHSVPSSNKIVGKTIADQLVAAGLSWKSYQENLPLSGADDVNYSNGTASNLTKFNASASLSATNLPPLTDADTLHAYAVKHNPFVYFQSVQEGTNPELSLHNVVPFDGPHGLYTDLASGNVPAFSYVVPNQCDDQHGQGNADAYCQEDPGQAIYQGNTGGTQVGMNPGLSAQADTTIHKLVTTIQDSAFWSHGHNIIVIVWDENDYSGSPTALPAGTLFPSQNKNRVVLAVDSNGIRDNGITSAVFYDSFSLLKSIEGGFKLPCLNHACDSNVEVMSDLFNK